MVLRRLTALLAAMLVVVGVIALSGAPSQAATVTKTVKCEIEIPHYLNWHVTNTTQFRVSSAGRVHVNYVTMSASQDGFNDTLRMDYDLRVKDSNAKLADGSFTGQSHTWRPSNGETIHGLKTTVRGVEGGRTCNATAAR
jgi:hypothetical protein